MTTKSALQKILKNIQTDNEAKNIKESIGKTKASSMSS